MALVVCAKFNSFKFGAQKFCSTALLRAKYTNAVSLDSNISAPLHRVSVTINHTNGSRFAVYGLLPLVSAGSWNIEHRGAQIDETFSDKVSVTINHTAGSEFAVYDIRPHVNIHKRRLVS